MHKFAIIGSDSYIATNFINSLNTDDNVKLFSRCISGKTNEIIKENLFDITAIDLTGSEIVVNFAAIVHQPDLKDENLYNEINFKLVAHIAKESKKAGVRHFIQMSSVAVYGNLKTIDINSKENPETIYGKTKLDADRYLLSIIDKNFNVTLVRPPMVYGVNAPGNLKRLIEFAQKGLPMPFKSISNSRDFIFIGNLIQVLHIVIEEKLYGIIIPTDRNPISTEELLYLIRKYSSKRVRIVAIPSFLLKIVRIFFPYLFNKLFGSLTINCSIPETHYTPLYKPEDGLREILINK